MSQAAYERAVPLPTILPPHPMVVVDRAVRDSYWTRRATWQDPDAQTYIRRAAIVAERK